jgi:hypothetical protein
MPPLVVQVLSPYFDRGHPLRDAFKELRHRYYCERLGYEFPSSSGRESDEFDEQAIFLVVLEAEEVVMGCRIIPSGEMSLPMQKKGEAPRKLRTPCVEISRMVASRTIARRSDVSELLYRKLYELVEPGYDFAYAVLEPKYLRALEHRFSRRAIRPVGRERRVLTPAGQLLTHIPVEISLREWGRCFEGIHKGPVARAIEFFVEYLEDAALKRFGFTPKGARFLMRAVRAEMMER